MSAHYYRLGSTLTLLSVRRILQYFVKGWGTDCRFTRHDKTLSIIHTAAKSGIYAAASTCQKQTAHLNILAGAFATALRLLLSTLT